MAAVADSKPEQSRGRFVTFLVDGLLCGVDVLRVQEVQRGQAMTRVPLAPEAVEGLMNLRGQIVTAIDMRRLFGVEPRAAGAAPMNVVIRTQEGAISLLADEIGDVADVEDKAIEPPPGNLEARARELVRGICQMDGGLLLLLDADKTAAAARH